MRDKGVHTERNGGRDRSRHRDRKKEGLKAKATDGDWRNAQRGLNRSVGRAKTGGGIRK